MLCRKIQAVELVLKGFVHYLSEFLETVNHQTRRKVLLRTMDV